MNVGFAWCVCVDVRTLNAIAVGCIEPCFVRGLLSVVPGTLPKLRISKNHLALGSALLRVLNGTQHYTSSRNVHKTQRTCKGSRVPKSPAPLQPFEGNQTDRTAEHTPTRGRASPVTE